MVDYNKITEIYGEEMLYLVKDNIDDVNNNLEYLYNLNIKNLEDVFERYIPAFICETETFRIKMQKLINKLGNNYIDILDEDSSYYEDLL